MGALATVLAVEIVDELVDGVAGAALPSIRSEFNLDYAQIGLLLGVPAIVGNVIEPFAAIGADVWRRRFLIAIGGVAFVGALGTIAAAPSFTLLLIGFILFYPASGTFVSISQASLMDADPGRREQNMARWTAAGYVGNIVGPLGLAAAVALGLGWREAYAVLALLAVIALVRMANFPFAQNVPHASLFQGFVEAWRHLRRTEVIRWLVLLEVSDLMLDLLTGFMAIYLVDVGKLTPAQAASVIGARAAAGFIGEIAVVALLERIRGLVYLRWSVVLTGLLYPVFLLVEPTWAKVATAIGLGLITAGWYSILQAQLYETLPERSGTALALKNVTGFVWGAVPIAFGAIAEGVGLQLTMWLLWSSPIALAVGLSVRLRSQPEKTGGDHGERS